MICEYAEIPKDQHSVRTVLATKTKGRREFRLVHKTKGFEPAGSCARSTGEAWGVLFEEDNATHGQWYLEEASARRLFAQWTD